MPGPRLTFYGGVGEIGGNKILVDDGETRVFLDFGKSYSKRGQFYEWNENPREINGVGDLLALGIAPRIKGIYREDLLQLANLWDNDEKEKSVDAVVLSHAHSDHSAYISLLREDIPIWMGEMTKTVLETMEEGKSGSLESSVISFRPRSKQGKLLDRVQREVHTFKTGESKQEVRINSISLEPIHVDHSMPGCYGFLIRTKNATIAYTGDLRLHGWRPDLTEDFMKRAGEEKPDVMLCEGTRITESHSINEGNVLESCKLFVNQAPHSFVYADYYFRDIDRFITFYELAKQTGRILLIDTHTAMYLIALAKQDPRMKLPSPTDANLGIYKGRKNLTEDKADAPLYAQSNVWTYSDVKHKESSVILSSGMFSTEQLIDIRPKGGLYLHATTEAYDESGEASEEMTDNWMRHFGLHKVHSHCSGHASANELVRIVNAINPKILVPIHTEAPERFDSIYRGKVKEVGFADSMEI